MQVVHTIRSERALGLRCCMIENDELRGMLNWKVIYLWVACVIWSAGGVAQTPSEVVSGSASIRWSDGAPWVAEEGFDEGGIPYGVWEWPTAGPWSGGVLLASEESWSPVPGLPADLAAALGELARKPTAVDGWPGATTRWVHGAMQLRAPLLRFVVASGSFERVESFSMHWGEDPALAEVPSTRQRDWPTASVLSEGELYRVDVAQDGIYKLDGAFWSAIGVDPESVAPESVTVFGNGGHALPMANDVPRPLDPATVAVVWNGEEGAAHVGEGEFVFWAEGPLEINYDEEAGEFSHLRNPYTDSASYFIRIDDTPGRPGARMGWAPAMPAGVVPDTVVTTFQHVAVHEAELHSPNRSGREWYGEEFGGVTERTFSFPVPFAEQETGRVDVALIARSLGASSSFALSAGNASSTAFPNPTSDASTAPVATPAAVTLVGDLVTGSGSNARIDVAVAFTPANADARGWLDFIRIQQSRSLRFTGSAEAFFGAEPESGWARYEVANAALVAAVWDITEPTQPMRVPFTLEGETAVFFAERNVMRRFLVLPGFGFGTPTVRGPVAGSNLHAWSNLDAVLITRPAYQEAAEMWAQMRADEGLAVGVAYQQSVFNEFSSGQPDPTALKMLMVMLRDRAQDSGGTPPRFLQLMGDGTFANRGGLATSPYLITYQSVNSLSPTSSYVSDDYFGFLEDGMGEDMSDKLAIGIGRIPCSNAGEAVDFVAKLKRYDGLAPPANSACGLGASQPEKGAWRNRVVLVSDDMDGSGGPTELSHMMNSDEHANTLAVNHPEYDVDKVYFDAYPQVSTPGGERYPDASDAIDQRVADGALIVNYIGHGGERGWAHERVLTNAMIRDWDNAYRMPLFMTATCELARFDDPEVESAGELMVMNPNGGAIGMLTTTRVVFSSSNQQLNRAFYGIALDDASESDLRLGDIVRVTKNDPQVSNSSNKRNFTLLGDATMRLAYPQHQVILSELPDSVRALDRFTGAGYIADAAGDTLSDFNGVVTVRVFDKRSRINTLNNDGGTNPYPYTVFRNVIHQGLASVVQGAFSFEFVVPRDIDFEWGAGRVSCYALDLERGEDAHGASEDWLIGGVNADFVLDQTPPQVAVYLNDTLFKNGGISGPNPILVVRAFDEGGINSAGSGIGHQMKAVIDGDWANALVLNGAYESDLDTYKRGTVRLPLEGLEPGPHTIEVVMWDVQNNQGRGSLEFTVVDGDGVTFDVVTAYPNPATDEVWFQLEHTAACDPVSYRLDAFDLSGRRVHSAAWEVESAGFRFPPFRWDLRAVKPGTYLCRITLETSSGTEEQHSERIVVLRP